jgi:RNA polymerase sigma factor for flagellar operon FliA
MTPETPQPSPAPRSSNLARSGRRRRAPAPKGSAPGAPLAAEPRRLDQLYAEYQRTRNEKIKAELAREYMPRIIAIAERVRSEMGGAPDLKDLVDAGVLGLLEAFERFDPSRGVYFETFCVWRVVGAMHDDQRKFDWASDAVRLKAHRLRLAADALAHVLGRQPSSDELAEALGISPAGVADVWWHVERKRPLRIDSKTRGRALEDSRHDPVRRLAAEEARALLLDALKALPDKERYVLLLYYFERLTMAQIGRVVNVTESRVCQLHKKALATLVRRLGTRKDELLDALGA